MPSAALALLHEQLEETLGLAQEQGQALGQEQEQELVMEMAPVCDMPCRCLMAWMCEARHLSAASIDTVLACYTMVFVVSADWARH